MIVVSKFLRACVCFLVVASTSLVTGQVLDAVYSVEEMINLCEIRNDFDKEGSVICDPAGVLSFVDRSDIENTFDGLEKTRFNVVVVPGMSNAGYGSLFGRSAEMITHRFALDMFNDLNIVKDSKEYDRALIFVSYKQKSAAIICDADMLRKISSDKLDSISQSVVDLVVEDQIADAIKLGIQKVNLAVSSKGNTGSQSNLESHLKKARMLKALKFAPRLFIGVFVLLGCFALWELNFDSQLRKGKVCLGQILDEFNRSIQPSAQKHRRASCPTCLDRFTAEDGYRENDPDEYSEEVIDTTVDAVLECDAVDDSTTTTRNIDTNKYHGCLLQCGHEFCSTCLKLHLLPKFGKVCPICLSDIAVPSEYHDNHSPPSISEENIDLNDFDENNALLNIYTGSDQKEILYRIKRVHDLYPRVMTSDTLKKCNDAASEHDFNSIHEIIQKKLEEVNTKLSFREKLLNQTALGKNNRHSRE